MKDTIQEDELKPCPFCGASAFLWGVPAGWKISCERDCVTMPPRADVWWSEKESLITHWNRRVKDKKAMQAVCDAAQIFLDVEYDVDVSECGQYVCIAKDEWYEHLTPAIFNLKAALDKKEEKND